MKIHDPRLRRLRDIRWLKQLIWAYFFLLIFEGALRKWIVPSLSTPLLLVRDPIVITAYVLAWRSNLFPRNVFIGVLAALSIATFAVGMFIVPESPLIAIYGFRSNFLQWPLIFIIGKVFDSRDVERVGFWFLLLAMPMAVLMVLQFLAPGDSFLNSGATEGTTQIASAMGRIRPPGTFSYVTGPSLYFSVVAAFLLYNQFNKRYSTWLTSAVIVATLCAAAVSGSRSLVSSMVVVFIFALASSFITRPQVAFRLLGSLLVLGIVAFFLTGLPFFQTGLDVFSARVSGASNYEGGSEGFLGRFFSAYTGFYPTLFDAPLLGKGLGMGTVVGLALMEDKTNFIWFENDWARHVLESGPFLGLIFILYRIAFVWWLGSVSIRNMTRHNPLPVLLFGSCVLLLLTGTIGQVTVQGFMFLLAGLCLAATRIPGKSQATSANISAEAAAAEAAATEPALSLAR